MESIKLLFAGDYCVRYGTLSMVMEGRSQELVKDILPELEDKDISLINFEGAINEGGQPVIKCGPNISMPEKCVELIKEGNFDIANIANNHVGDYGQEGVLSTIKSLEKNGIMHLGAGINLENSRKPLMITCKGIKIAFLSYAENEFGLAGYEKAGVSPMNIPDNIRQIRKVSDTADITVVIAHGGNEHNPLPNPDTIKAYRSYIDAGASAVIGIHTHCPQSYERYGDGCIIYSMGNFLFDVKKENYASCLNSWWKGYMTKLEFSGKKLQDIRLIPYGTEFDAPSIKLLTGAEKESFLNYIEKLCLITADREKLLDYWYAWCAIHGPSWLSRLQGADWEKAQPGNDDYIKVADAMHRFTCQSHNSLMTWFLKSVYEGKYQKAKKFFYKIRELQDLIVK